MLCKKSLYEVVRALYEHCTTALYGLVRGPCTTSLYDGLVRDESVAEVLCTLVCTLVCTIVCTIVCTSIVRSAHAALLEQANPLQRCFVRSFVRALYD